MRLVPAYIFLVVLLGLHQKHADAARSLEVSSGGVTLSLASETLQVCPGTTVGLRCSHDSTADLSRWVITPPLQIDCNTAITHTNTPNGEGVCGPFTISMISAISEQPRRSTLELVVTESLNGAVVTCFAGASISDPLVGNLTIQIIGPPSLPTISSMEYSVIDLTTGQITLLAISAGTFGTTVSFYGSIEGIGTVVVTDNNITVTGLSYTESHTVNVVATSDVCPGVLNSSVTDVPVVFNIRTLVLTQPTGFLDCSNPSLPISGSWSAMEGIQSSNNPTVQLTPPLNAEPTVTYTSESARGLSGNAVFVPDSSYQLSDTVENDVYTFTVTVTNAAGPSSTVSEKVVVAPFIVDESTLETMNCLTFSLSQNCASEQSGNFLIKFKQGNGICRDLVLSDFSTSTIQLMPRSACAPVASFTNLCYRATLMYNGIVIGTYANRDFAGCPVSVLPSFLADGVSYQLDGEVTSGNVSHLTTATLSCTETFASVSGAAVVTCVDGQWNNMGIRGCSRSCAETTAISVIVTFLLTVALGSIGVFIVLAVNRYRRSEKITLQTETEMRQPPVAIYEDPDVVKPDPRTQGNAAYGHVQFS